MSNIARLTLGTAQFGFPYGFNHAGTAIAPAEAGRILALAWERGIDMLDTAADYGEAESTIGNAKPAHAAFRIVSKTPRIGADRISPADLEKIGACARRSIQRLKIEALDSILVHHAPDLLGPGGEEMFDLLQSLKQKGMVERIGVSVYDPETLRRVLARYPVEVVQLPLNIFDQRFAQGVLDMLAGQGIEVHVRSVFLQGVLLMASDRLPVHLRKAGSRLATLQSDAAAAGVPIAAAALQYVATQPAVSRIVFGVQNAAELYSNVDMFTATPSGLKLDFRNYRIDDREIIDPRCWPV
jgi:aryl-alcohol dehydrogenase-like predicted oxidoreductase